MTEQELAELQERSRVDRLGFIHAMCKLAHALDDAEASSVAMHEQGELCWMDKTFSPLTGDKQ
jgi:hypothetical protein